MSPAECPYKILLFLKRRPGMTLEAFRDYYKDIVELNLTNEIDDFTVVRVNAETGEVATKAGRTEKAGLANIIPAQKAGAIAAKAGLTEGDWCPVNPDNFTSTKVPGIYVIGDAAKAADMPKSAYSAMSQATAVAADILADIGGKPRGPGKYRNTCWSMVAPDNSAKIGADYAPGVKDGAPILAASGAFVSKAGESADLRRETHAESLAWYDTLVAGAFGTPSAPAKAP